MKSKKTASILLAIFFIITSSLSVFADPPPTSMFPAPNGGSMTGFTESNGDPDGTSMRLVQAVFLTREQSLAFHYSMTHKDWATQVKDILKMTGIGAATTKIALAIGVTGAAASTCLGIVISIADYALDISDQVSFERAYETSGNGCVRIAIYACNFINWDGTITSYFARTYSPWNGDWAESPAGYRASTFKSGDVNILYS